MSALSRVQRPNGVKRRIILGSRQRLNTRWSPEGALLGAQSLFQGSEIDRTGTRGGQGLVRIHSAMVSQEKVGWMMVRAWLSLLSILELALN